MYFNLLPASAHVTCRSSDDYMGIANSIKKFFHDEGIHSTTIQPEFIRDHKSDANSDKECVLECGLDMNCAAQKCCPGDGELRKRLGISTVCVGSLNPAQASSFVSSV